MRSSSPSGLARFCSAIWAISVNTGDSSTPERIQKPRIIRPMESRNGMRQPHSMKASPGAIMLMSASMPDDSRSPAGAPACGPAPNRPRFSTGACSTASSTAEPHSPPAEMPWMMRKRMSSSGAAMPIVS